MKTWHLIGFLSFGLVSSSWAGDYQVTADKKRFSVERSKSVSTQTSNEQWGYSVQIKNTSFKPAPGSTVEYIVFSRDSDPGSNSAPKNRRHKGSKTVNALKASEVFKFETEPIEITKSQLVGGWYYANGAKPQAKDALTGIWLRVMADGKLAFEYMEPSNLSTKEVWDKEEKK